MIDHLRPTGGARHQPIKAVLTQDVEGRRVRGRLRQHDVIHAKHDQLGHGVRQREFIHHPNLQGCCRPIEEGSTLGVGRVRYSVPFGRAPWDGGCRLRDHVGVVRTAEQHVQRCIGAFPQVEQGVSSPAITVA